MFAFSEVAGSTELRALAIGALFVLGGCAGPASIPMAHPGSNAVPQAGFGSSVFGSAFLGCPYPTGDVYQTNISGVTPDPNSAAYIQAMLDAPNGDTGFQLWPGLQVINEAMNATPMISVDAGNSYDIPTVSQFPWQSNFFIQLDGDHHSLVLNTQSCQYYEGYKTVYYASGNYLTMYNNTEVDLRSPFVRPATGALSTATGIPLGMLAVRPEELNAGIILHALGWNPVSGSLNGGTGARCVNPAGKVRCTDPNYYDGPPSDTPMPYGSHGRLKASVDISGFSREAKIVATAMKTYGMYVYDTGCCHEIIAANDQYGQPTWTTQDATSLATITPSEIEIVPPPLAGQGRNDVPGTLKEPLAAMQNASRHDR
jgi:hypothetical protein